MKGTLRLRPPRAQRAPALDLHLVLDALGLPPFEPRAQAVLKLVSTKTAFVLATASAKGVGELHAVSVSDSCLRWNSDGSGVTLWPNPPLLPKVLKSSNLNRSVCLAQYIPPEGEDRLKMAVSCAGSESLRSCDRKYKTVQLFLCYGGPRRGCALSSSDYLIGLWTSSPMHIKEVVTPCHPG